MDHARVPNGLTSAAWEQRYRAPRFTYPQWARDAPDRVVYASNHEGDPATGQAMAGDVTAQTERVIENIKGILENAGTSLAYAVENLCFLADVRRDFAAFNAVYGRYFDTNGPTRTTVQAMLPRDGLLVEIRCLAVMPPAA